MTDKTSNTIHYRHEWKHELNYADMLALRPRLQAVMRLDPHCIGDKYMIRSLYFDTPNDRALREKIDGVNMREKFRIRYYNADPSFMHLEKKAKKNGLCAKFADLITAEEAQKIVNGDIDWIMEDTISATTAASSPTPHQDVDPTTTNRDQSWTEHPADAAHMAHAITARPLLHELYCKMKYQGLSPKTIVDYTREPFIFDAGNVRVTLDYDIRTGLFVTDFLNPDCLTIPAGAAAIILEVKWDEYLPDIIRDMVHVPSRHVTAFSKYAQCRIYG